MIIVNGLLYVYTSNTCIDSCNHHHNQDTGQFQHLKSSLWCPLWCPFVVSLPAQPQPLVITDLFILSFLECHGSGTLQYATLFIYLFIYSFIHPFMAALGLCCCARAFSSCSERGLLFVVVCGLLTAVASLVEHRLQ